MSTRGGLTEHEDVVELEQEPHHQLVLVNDAARVFWVEVGEGESTLMHRHHYDYVTVVIGDSVIGNRKQGEAEQRQELPHGEMLLARAGLIHQVRNASDKPFRNIVVSVLVEGETGKASMVSRVQNSDAEVKVKIEEAHVSAAKLTLEREEMKLVGEGLLATLDGEVELRGSGGHVRLSRVGDFAWVSGMTRVKSEGRVELALVEVR